MIEMDGIHLTEEATEITTESISQAVKNKRP